MRTSRRLRVPPGYRYVDPGESDFGDVIYPTPTYAGNLVDPLDGMVLLLRVTTMEALSIFGQSLSLSHPEEGWIAMDIIENSVLKSRAVMPIRIGLDTHWLRKE